MVTGPIIISIGLILAPTAISNASQNWLLAFIALAVIVVCNIWGKGMVKIVPILLGILVSYVVAVFMGEVNFEAIASAKVFARLRFLCRNSASVRSLPLCRLHWQL